MLAQKQREIDQLTEENRLLRVELENFEEERSRVVVLERSTRQSQEELRQSQEELRHSEEHRQVALSESQFLPLAPRLLQASWGRPALLLHGSQYSPSDSSGQTIL